MKGNTKQIVILGAGASKSEKAPLQGELFTEFFNYYKTVLKGKIWSLSKSQERLIIHFFKDFWGIDIYNYQKDNVKFPTFEECLGVLDLAYFRGESFREYTKEKINKIRSALIFLIAKVLDEKLKGKIIYHKKLIDRLESEKTLKETAFLSLNYDIIIDSVLVNLYPKYHLDYGVEFVNFKRENDWERPDQNKSISLLKPHGSLNWLYCPTCNHIERTPQKAVDAFYKANPCKDCRTPMKPVIIPPTFYKDISNPFIQQIFLKADEILRSADKIFVCGYSFPDADMHIKYLLKRAERFRGNTPEIYVINNHCGKRDKTEQRKDDEKKRYLRFFRDKKKVYYTDISFEKFSEEGV